MTISDKNLTGTLNNCAIIIRKYNLGDADFFFSKFPNIDKNLLQSAWYIALINIRHNEIIKFNPQQKTDNLSQVDKKLKQFDNDTGKLYHYLNSHFDAKQLKLADENAERRIRNILASKYVDIVSKQVSKSSSSTKRFGSFKVILIIVGLVSLFFIPRIIEGLTPVDVLTEKIHEKSKYKFNGSVCNDGHISHSQGRGTCSWHKGVKYKFYKGDYKKTIDECRTEAIKLSWRD